MRWLGMLIVSAAALALVTELAYAQAAVDMRAIRLIESSDNPQAFNAATRCYGLYQISEICLREYNVFQGTELFPDDLFDPLLNERIATWYFQRIRFMLDFYGIPQDITAIIACYNWGIGNVRRWYDRGAPVGGLPAQTRDYIRRYLDLCSTPAVVLPAEN